MKLEDIRREYLRGGLSRRDLAADPIEQFNRWMEQALGAEITDPSAMTLATADARGRPSQRIVLLKGVDARGFVFYTNFTSHKGRELADNPQVSLHFPWHSMERQVAVTGRADRLSASESAAYFASRPRESQIAAWASHQSRPIDSRETLMARFEQLKERFAGGEVPAPDFWGGYRVAPETVEFWQGGAMRLHDRFVYRCEGEHWQIDRLAP